MAKKLLLVLAVLSIALAPVFCRADAAEDFAAKHRVKLWSFETGTTEGWHGNAKWAKSCSVTNDPKYVTEGKYALKINPTGSKDWNQDIAVNDGPFTPDVNKLVELSVDVNVPASSIKGMEFEELYLVCSSKTNNWYQVKTQLTPGKQTVVFKIDNSKIKQDMWHIYLVVNNSQPWTGPIYIDNIIGRVQGAPGSVSGKVVDKDTKQGIKGAKVVIGEALVDTDGDGNFKMTIPEDAYKAAFVAFGYRDKASEVIVPAGQDTSLGTVELLKIKEPAKEAVNVTIDTSKIIRVIDKHKLLGVNMAAWHKPEGYRDQEALNKLKLIGATLVRVPGGDYGNLYNWKTGEVYRFDGSVNWTPEFNYMGGYVPFMKRMEALMGPGSMEALPVINILTPLQKSIDQRIEYGIEWLQDMKDKGIFWRYVEIGNELDNKPDVPGPKKGKNIFTAPGDPKVIHWWTNIDNYSKVFNEASYKIKKVFPEAKIAGPVIMQPFNRQRVQGDPWKADTDTSSPYWVEKFLKNCGKYVDVVSVHEYPLWANNDSRALMGRPQETWPKYMPKFREWIKKYVNSIKGYEHKNIEVSLTEWNSGDENIMTALIDNGLFCADYLGSFMKQGGDLACIWDLYTQKPGQGGGHGLMDEENDPTNKYSERSHYWVFDMYNNAFGTKMVKCESDNPNLSVYAALVDDNTLSVMAINKTKLAVESAKINTGAFNAGGSAKVWQLSSKEYVWSKELYRPIVNSGPSIFDVSLNNMTYDFPPYSVTVLILKK